MTPRPGTATAVAHENAPEKVPDTLLEPLARLRSEAVAFLKGKETLVDTLLSALLASGHVLFEDVPGVGKTTLIKAVAKWLGLEMARVQCTSDLLPSDILGVEVYSSSANAFTFHPGPLFANIVLVDELNRASPRTQSALLEAMAEGMVSVNRKSHPLPQPFIVFATQNPSDYVGTYPLPESQLDRFAARVHLHYPSDEREREILSAAAWDPLATLKEQILDLQTLRSLQEAAHRVFVSDRVVSYAKRVVDATRRHDALRLGVSTRGGVIWLRMARARALVAGRAFVTPDDLLAVARECLCHRVVSRSGEDTRPIVDAILNGVDVD